MEIFSTFVKTFIGNFDRDCTESIDGSGEHDRKRSTVVIKCYVLLDLNYYNFVKFFTFIFVMYIPIQLYCYVFSFFFLARGLSIFLYAFKNQSLVLLIFSCISLVSISCISAVILMISFLFLTLGFFCSFFQLF